LEVLGAAATQWRAVPGDKVGSSPHIQDVQPIVHPSAEIQTPYEAKVEVEGRTLSHPIIG